LNGFSMCIVNNYLYISGGLLNNQLTDHTWKFDPIHCKWSKRCTMLNKRAFHLSLAITSANETHMEYILCFFGFTCNSNGQHVKSMTIECYDVFNDTWSMLNLNSSPVSDYNFMNFFDSYRNSSEPNQLSSKKSIVSLRDIIYVLRGK
jgi:hypothetical protein